MTTRQRRGVPVLPTDLTSSGLQDLHQERRAAAGFKMWSIAVDVTRKRVSGQRSASDFCQRQCPEIC